MIKNRCGGSCFCLYYSAIPARFGLLQLEGDMRLQTSNHAFLKCGMILLLLLNSALQGLVLCFGSDGHRAIESEHEGACRHAKHFPADPSESLPHESIVNAWGPNFFCRDVHFHLDRLANDTETRQRILPVPLSVHSMPCQGTSDVPCFGLYDFRPIFTGCGFIPPAGKKSTLRC
jgi:hypothetical protein